MHEDEEKELQRRNGLYAFQATDNIIVAVVLAIATLAALTMGAITSNVAWFLGAIVGVIGTIGMIFVLVARTRAQKRGD